MRTINTKLWKKAKISDSSDYDIKVSEWHDGMWHSGEWHGGRWWTGTWANGVWHYGDWHNGIWYNGIWKEGTWFNNTFSHWLSGQWTVGRIVKVYRKTHDSVFIINISPKSFKRPKRTLSLNYAAYTKNT